MAMVLVLCKEYKWEPNFWRRMGRRYFYLIVDETHRRQTAHERRRVGSWEGYENDPWYQEQRKRTGRKPYTGEVS